MSTSQAETSLSSTADPDSPLFFSDWLQRRRKHLDLTQAELANRACCSVFALRKIEAGDRRPSKQLAAMLAKALGLPLDLHQVFIKVARGELGLEKLAPLDGVSPPSLKPSATLGNLPRALTPFVGREVELAALAGLLGDPQCSLLTIVGPGGIGKTRLGIAAAEHMQAQFPDGSWFVPLAPVNSPLLIVPTIAESVGLKFQDPTNLAAQLLRYLHAKKALLLMDNAEHLVDGVGVFSEILKDCPHVKLLVTSRERLNLSSEWVFDVQGLPLPLGPQVKHFEAYSSVVLFLQSARRVQVGFELASADHPWVLKICQIVDGMPLGIELSAAWVGMLSVEEIATEIERSLDFLSVEMHDFPERHRSMRATLDQSWKLLSAEEKLILSRLSVFHGSFNRDSAQAVCEANLAVLSSLKNKSLLRRTDRDEYDLHEIIRQYAVLRLADYPAEAEHIREQHALYFVSYLARCEKDLQGARQVETLDAMAKIIDNLAQGWLYMVTHCRSFMRNGEPFPDALLHSALFSTSLFYEQRCRSGEVIALFKESVDYLKSLHTEMVEPADSACLSSILGHISAHLGLHYYYVLDIDKARELLEEAIQLLDMDHSRVEQAQARVMLAWLRYYQGKTNQASGMFEQSRQVFKEAGQTWWYTLSTTELAAAFLTLGRLDEAIALYQEGFDLVDPGDLRIGLSLRGDFAIALAMQNDFAKAEQLLQENLQLSYRLRNDRLTSHIYFDLSRVALADRRIEQAENYLQQSFNIITQFGESHDLALNYLYSGRCSIFRGHPATARQQFRQVIRIGLALDQFHLVHDALVYTARAYIQEGQAKQALKVYLLLRLCQEEDRLIQEQFKALTAELRAALPAGQIDGLVKQAECLISRQESEAAVLAYAKLQALEDGTR